MRLFGILLIFANLLAGAGFVYLATENWKGRQTITAAGVRHLLLLQGLPLEGADLSPDDETPFVVQMGGGESTKTISKKLLDSYFQANTAASAPAADASTPAAGPAVPLASNATVTSQIAEVKRVQGVIKAKLAEEVPPAEKIALLKGWLLYQAETYEARSEYLSLSSPIAANGQPKTPDQLKADATKLEELLDARFAAVLAKSQVTDSPAVGSADAPLADKDVLAKSAAWRAGPALDEAERRAKLAHLLVHLDTDEAWQKRVAVVVGLRRYVGAISNQVPRFADMIAHVELGIPGDQAAFVNQETLVREQATQNAERARAVAAQRAKTVEQKTAADDAVNRHRTQLKELTDQLNKIKGEVDAQLVRQAGIEQQLFEIQREVGLTLEDVYRLEALLDRVERERFGLPPRAEP